MICQRCGHENDLGAIYCTACGEPFAPPPQIHNPVSSRFLALFRDKLFLVLCVLISVSIGANFLAGAGLSITGAIILGFLWALYADAKKSVVKSSNIRVISGTLFAEFILDIVGAVACVLMGVLFAAASVFLNGLSADSEVAAAILQALKEANFYLKVSGFSVPISWQTVKGLLWISSAIMLFGALEMIVVYAIGYRKLNRLTKSAYKGVESGELEIAGLGGVKVWLVLFAVVNGLSAMLKLLSLDLFGVASDATKIAAIIVAIKLMENHLSTEN